jgi:hypothetical protein
MKTHYVNKKVKPMDGKQTFQFFLVLLFSFLPTILSSLSVHAADKKDCINHFSSEIVKSEITDNCLNVSLQINANKKCPSALSHLTISIPCGTISDASNSEEWKMEIPSKDPTSGIYGIKVDEISNFGEDGIHGTFTVDFTVCSDDNTCLRSIKDTLQIAYKAGTCIFYEDVINTTSLTAQLVTSDISCYGGNNGAIEAVVSGGTPPYSFSWSNGSTTQNINGLIAGDYTLTITDSDEGLLSLSASVIQPLSSISIQSQISQASCSTNDGAINLSLTGGTPPYSYQWNNGEASASLAGLYAGTYIVQVTDATGCTKTQSFVVTEDSDLSISLTPNLLQCHQEGQGEITSVVSGGTAPYTYIWSNGDTTPNLSNVNSGRYLLTVTDTNGCSATASTYINIPKLMLSTGVINPTCNGGSDGEVSVTNVRYGTAPYNYLWDTGETTATLSEVESGRYRVTVTDANGCEVSRTINLADRQALSFNYAISKRDCSVDATAEITLNGSGGMPPYKYYINDELIQLPLQLTDGEHEITMVDALGCELTKTISISGDSPNMNIEAIVTQPTCDVSGVVQLIATGGVAPYRYTWSDGSTEKDRNNLAAGDYQVEVLDVNGCSVSTSIQIIQSTELSATIISGQESIICGTGGNMVQSISEGASSFTWEIIDNSNIWNLEEANYNSASIFAGENEAKLVFTVMNEDGCSASDTLILQCSIDPSTGEDPDDNEDGNDDTCEIPEAKGCTYTKINKITPLGSDNCYQIKMTVYTDGTCEHELSHLNIGLEHGTIYEVTNSYGWKVEKNSTDPKTGIYGLKIDDIDGFGQDGNNEFAINFEVCFNHPTESNYFPDSIPVVYKAATEYTLQIIETFENKNSESGLYALAYPNPFRDNLFIDIISKSDTEVEVEIWDIHGEKIKTLYKGKVTKDLKYTFSFNPPASNDLLYFYKVKSTNGVTQGKLLRVH